MLGFNNAKGFKLHRGEVSSYEFTDRCRLVRVDVLHASRVPTYLWITIRSAFINAHLRNIALSKLSILKMSWLLADIYLKRKGLFSHILSRLSIGIISKHMRMLCLRRTIPLNVRVGSSPIYIFALDTSR